MGHLAEKVREAEKLEKSLALAKAIAGTGGRLSDRDIRRAAETLSRRRPSKRRKKKTK